MPAQPVCLFGREAVDVRRHRKRSFRIELFALAFDEQRRAKRQSEEALRPEREAADLLIAPQPHRHARPWPATEQVPVLYVGGEAEPAIPFVGLISSSLTASP